MTLSRRLFATGGLAAVVLAGLAAVPASAKQPAEYPKDYPNYPGNNCHGGKHNELLLVCDAPKGKYLPKASDEYRWRDDRKQPKASDEYRWHDDRKQPGWVSNWKDNDRRPYPYPYRGQNKPY